MSDSKKKREAARQQIGQMLKEKLDTQLAETLNIADPAARFLAVLNLQKSVGDLREETEKCAKEDKSSTCFWTALGMSTPISIAWIVVEPFTGVMNLLAGAIVGLSPAIMLQDALKLTGIGNSHLKDAQVISEQVNAFQGRAQEALEIIAKNNLDELAASPLAADLRQRSSMLDKAMAEAFAAAARKKLETPPPPPKQPPQGLNL